MPAVAAATIPTPTTAGYRRQARRLRCRFAGQPAALQRSLKRLATRCDAEAVQPTRQPPPVDTSLPCTGAARAFADYLFREAGEDPSGILSYSRRLHLLTVARRLGIARFEANLLIAAVLERQRRQRHPAAEDDNPGPQGFGLLGNLTIFALLQGALVLGAWWTLVR